jgi:hypothetical protein
MWPMVVAMCNVDGQHGLERTSADDKPSGQALAAIRADEPFGVSVYATTVPCRPTARARFHPGSMGWRSRSRRTECSTCTGLWMAPRRSSPTTKLGIARAKTSLCSWMATVGGGWNSSVCGGNSYGQKSHYPLDRTEGRFVQLRPSHPSSRCLECTYSGHHHPGVQWRRSVKTADQCARRHREVHRTWVLDAPVPESRGSWRSRPRPGTVGYGSPTGLAVARRCASWGGRRSWRCWGRRWPRRSRRSPSSTCMARAASPRPACWGVRPAGRRGRGPSGTAGRARPRGGAPSDRCPIQRSRGHDFHHPSPDVVYGRRPASSSPTSARTVHAAR